ncbi:histidinol-phosphate transaminase [Lentimicrobium sp. S6]|uniref:histidinol-phosphate transaminase n=1 Tax=Lentimicrobium sp. S6 TaxID=2735872 RepID=UPI0015540466|nr:histidinol-phosphate transaminase [Lentimicrobium sp. S6]NPD45756.1 histidinol-phosphate transaminase [Lentimicrobium sp. S6]
MFNINQITRKNIKELTPYSSAREEFQGSAQVFLDANENPYETAVNRYPDPQQRELKMVFSKIKGLDENQIFIGNGSDEIIDLLFRAFCEPQEDKAFVFPPTYGMYEVSAQINNVEIIKIPLNTDFQLPPLEEIEKDIKSGGLLFICSPNNPTGNAFPLEEVKRIADRFYGLVVLDEAYIDFAVSESGISILETTPNLVLLQTMSKAYGLAGLRVGMAFAHPEVIGVLNKIKPPYNVNSLSQTKVVDALIEKRKVAKQISEIKTERLRLIRVLEQMNMVKTVFPSESNFVLVEFEQADLVMESLRNQGIIIRDKSKEIKDALRLTIGTPEQNQLLIKALKNI